MAPPSRLDMLVMSVEYTVKCGGCGRPVGETVRLTM